VLVELVGKDLDRIAEVADLRIEVHDVTHDVALLVVPHDERLRAAQPPHAGPEHQHEHQQDQ